MEALELKMVDLIIVCSQRDARLLRRLFPFTEKDLLILPNGVDTRYHKPNRYLREEMRKCLNLEGKVTLLFIGSLKYKPNLEGILEFLRKSFPKLLQRYDNIVLLLVGSYDKKALRELLPYLQLHKDKILLVGYVDDIRGYANAADIAIAPLKSGSGTRIKVLTYMAYGLPVVATPKAIEGLYVKNHQDVVVVGIELFDKAIVKLITDKSFYFKLSSNTLEIVNKYYAWQTLVTKLSNKLIQLYEKLRLNGSKAGRRS